MLEIERFVNHLKELGVEGEIWIGGSFVTAKPHPKDFDVVLVIDGEFLNAADPVLVEKLTKLGEVKLADYINGLDQKTLLKKEFNCDFNLHIKHKVGDSEYWFSEYMYSYYMKLLGFNRGQDTLKGIAVIKI